MWQPWQVELLPRASVVEKQEQRTWLNYAQKIVKQMHDENYLLYFPDYNPWVIC